MKPIKDYEISITIKINKFDPDYFVSENHCRAYIAVLILGLKVFPIKPDTRKPLIKGGQKQATKNIKQIDLWWAKFPTANVGTSI